MALPWVLTWLSCQQRARSRAGGNEQQLVAAIALASSPGWTTSAPAAYQSCARSWTTRRSSRRLPSQWQRRLLSLRGPKQALLSSGAAPTMLTVPAVDAFQAPIGAQSAHATQSAAPTSVVTTVKIGVRAVVTARMIMIAETTSFADRLAIAFASQPVEERAKMAALPVKRHGALCARARSARAASTMIRPRASARSAGQRPRTRTGASHGAAPSASRRARRRSASRSWQPVQPEGRGTKRGR